MSRIDLRCRLRRGALELDVDTTLEHGATGLFGRSGAGKTSLLLALAGLVPATDLVLRLDGESLVDTSRGFVPPPHRRRVGVMFQEHRLFPHISVERNLRFGHEPTSGAPEFDELVDLLELHPLLDRRPSACSGGEQQRVALGRALLNNPRLLLLDEPLSSLDRGLKRQILPYLRRVRGRFDIPLLVVSHDLADLLTLTDELVLLDGGRVVAQGTMNELVLEPSNLESLHDAGLMFAIPGTVARVDDDGLAWVRADGPSGKLVASGDCREALDTRVEVLLRPEDVILARPPVETQLSTSNHFEGTIAHVTHGTERVIVAIDCGLAVPLLAEVTERAVRRLELTPGASVVALSKAQATRTRRV